MASNTSIPLAKIAATSLGLALCGVESWLNAGYIAKSEGLASPMVAAVIVASIGAAAALPFAERSAKEGQWLKTVTPKKPVATPSNKQLSQLRRYLCGCAKTGPVKLAASRNKGGNHEV